MKHNRNMLKLSTNTGFSKIQPFKFCFSGIEPKQNILRWSSPIVCHNNGTCHYRPIKMLFANARHVILKGFRAGSRCSPLHWLETYRTEAFAKRQSVTARTRKKFENPRAKPRQEVQLNIKFT